MTDPFWLFYQLGGVVLGLALCAIGSWLVWAFFRVSWILVYEIYHGILRIPKDVMAMWASKPNDLLYIISLLAFVPTFSIFLLAFIEPSAKILFLAGVLPFWAVLLALRVRNWRKSKIHNCGLSNCSGEHRSHA